LAEPGFTSKDLLCILTHAPSETAILRPQPEDEPVEVASPGQPDETEADALALV
jgi:hypothetical protein